MPKNDSQFNKIKNVPAWGLIAMYGIMNKLSPDIKAGNKIFNAPLVTLPSINLSTPNMPKSAERII